MFPSTLLWLISNGSFYPVYNPPLIDAPSVYKPTQNPLRSCISPGHLVKRHFPVCGKEGIASHSLIKLSVAISSQTLMRKPRYLFIFYSFLGEKISAPDRDSTFTAHLQSCRRDRGRPDVTATPDTLCGWQGCKAISVDVEFPNVYW